jgi:hypothetical protein
LKFETKEVNMRVLFGILFLTSLFTIYATTRAVMSTVDLDKLEPEKITVGRVNGKEDDDELDEKEKFHEELKAILRKSRKTGVIYKDKSGKIFTNGEYRFQLLPEVRPEYFSHIEYRIGAGNFKRYEEPVALEEEGIYKLSYRGVDLLGNLEETRSYNIRVDRTPPEVDVDIVGDEFKGADGNSYFGPGAKLEVRAFDKVSGLNMILVNINSQGNMPIEKVETTFTKGGEYDIAVRALDNVYNLSKKVKINFFIDNYKPQVFSKITPELKTISGKKFCKVDSVITLYGKDEQSGLNKIEFSFDKEKWFDYGNPIVVSRTSPLKEENNYFLYFRGVDNTGNVSDPVEFQCILDYLPPKTYIKIYDR